MPAWDKFLTLTFIILSINGIFFPNSFFFAITKEGLVLTIGSVIGYYFFISSFFKQHSLLDNGEWYWQMVWCISVGIWVVAPWVFFIKWYTYDAKFNEEIKVFLVLAVVFVSMFTFAARLKKQRQQNKD
jgi:uncharacterized membrane protein (UPF0136 family)